MILVNNSSADARGLVMKRLIPDITFVSVIYSKQPWRLQRAVDRREEPTAVRIMTTMKFCSDNFKLRNSFPLLQDIRWWIWALWRTSHSTSDWLHRRRRCSSWRLQTSRCQTGFGYYETRRSHIQRSHVSCLPGITSTAVIGLTRWLSALFSQLFIGVVVYFKTLINNTIPIIIFTAQKRKINRNSASN